MTVILFIEWFAMAISIFGSLLMSLKIGRASEVVPWGLWMAAACMLIYLFSLKGQHGMMFWQISGLVSSTIGLMAWFGKGEARGRPAQLALALTVIYILLVIYCAAKVVIDPKVYSFEWLGGVLSACAAFLMASRTVYSPFAWLFWFVGNLILIVTSYLSQQYGVLTLNAVFTVTNTIGIYRWILPNLFKKNVPNSLVYRILCKHE